MKKNASIKGIVKLSAVAYLIALVGVVELINGCNKRGGDGCEHPGRDVRTSQQQAVKAGVPIKTVEGYRTLTSVLTVACISVNLEGKTEVTFYENAEYFTVEDAAVIAKLKGALNSRRAQQVTFDPWKGVVLSVFEASHETNTGRQMLSSGIEAQKVDLAKMNAETLDEPTAIGVMNTTSPGLVNVIPDFATAQLMFEYITKQCCAVSGPYGVDYCISFQYCQDGCYARAHKMCYIINKRYHYGTQKVFSFALPKYSGPYKLSVQAQKWGGCCVQWWYHVAPLVTVQTPTGPKAYVFDPAMFDQPVLLSQWLHAQENPACQGAYTAKVTKISVQPTSAYWPADTSGTTFSTDPSYSSTNSTLNTYRYLVTCP
jgi:hypothetical protein